MSIKYFSSIDKLYSQKYDAYYNARTGEWLEKKCRDTECEFCKDRPETYVIDEYNANSGARLA
jgi:hypothetical protein